MRKNTRQHRRFSFTPVVFFRGHKRHGLGQVLELSLSGTAVFTPADFDFGQPRGGALPRATISEDLARGCGGAE